MSEYSEDLVIIADHREEPSGIPEILAADGLFQSKKFGSLSPVFAATERELSEIPGAGLKIARRIKGLLT